VVKAFAEHDGDWWSERFTAAGTMNEQVNDHLKFLEHPQVAATGLIAWLDQPGIGKVPVPNVPGLQPLVPGSPLAISPTVGEHSAEILGALGYKPNAVAAFAARGVINAGATA
jgi:crotonobetainyl-CoA:carnitine CoA-transferase CaiB-like acyl-CoA transferase